MCVVGVAMVVVGVAKGVIRTMTLHHQHFWIALALP